MNKKLLISIFSFVFIFGLIGTAYAVHELGHALGLGHSVLDNVMYIYVTDKTSLGVQDKNDYNYLWDN